MEYQFYEFKTVNRTLTKAEQTVVDTWSSRSKATPTGAKFIYHYGDFRHNPEQCLLDYFDMMLYHANFGCRRIMFRFPENLVDVKALRAYEYDFEAEGDYEHSLKITVRGDYVLIDIEENLQDGGYEEWVDCEDTLGSLTTLWTDIVNGDYRCLYMAWVHFASLALESEAMEDEDLEEPPVPANLYKLTGALSEFAQFWGISEDLIKAAAKGNTASVSAQVDFKPVIANLSEAEKTDFLWRFLQNEPHLAAVFTKHLENLSGSNTPQYQTIKRTIQELLDAEIAVEHARVTAERAAATAKRQVELKNMASRADKMWEDVYSNLNTKIGSGYDRAVALLIDLKELSIFQNQEVIFAEKMAAITSEYGRSAVLVKRFTKAGLA